jgi:DNA polymerase III epsilon subunit-like protein
VTEQLKVPDTAVLAYNLRRLLGASLKLPEDIFIFDLETTALSPQSGVIWQIGYYGMSGGKIIGDPINGNSIYLKHSPDVLRNAHYEIGRRRAAITGEEPTYGSKMVKDAAYKQAEDQFISEIETKGQDPADVLATSLSTMKTMYDNGSMLGGQNFVKFDCPWLIYNAERYGIDYEFPDERLFDTGMQIKAAVLGRRITANDTYRQFYSKIGGVRAKGVYFAIERFCIPFWKLDEVYGVDTERAHDAGYDCYITWLVVKEMVDMIKNYDGREE